MSAVKIPASRKGQYALLVAAVLLTRIPFRSRLLYDLDSVNFATGMLRFDVTVSQPHAPGYYLYIVLARLFALVLPTANDALVAISVLFSCLTVVAIHRLTESLFDRRSAFAAGCIFVFSPLFWFHGTVALVYVVEGFFSAFVGWLCWQTYSGEKNRSVASAVALAVCIGFRQSACLFLGPLWLLSLRGRTWPEIARAVAVSGLVCVAWFVPMAMESGGAMAYLQGLYDLWTGVAAKQTTFVQPDAAGGAWLTLARALTILAILALTFGFFIVGSLAHLMTAQRRQQGPGDGRGLFFAVWLGPGLLFFTFVFLRFVNSGYVLVLTPPLFAWLGWFVSQRYTADASPLRRATPYVLAGLNAWVFLYAPLYCSWSSVVEFEHEWTETVASVRESYDPQTTLLVGLDLHFHGFRHASYYLPEYEIVAYPSASVAGAPRILTAHDRDSRMALAPESLPYDQLVFFPMPRQEAYESYLDSIVAATPGLEKRTTPGRMSAVGSMDVFRRLYPAIYQDAAD